MGCHTWFARPMTNDEFELMKEYCVQEAEELYGDTSENRQYEDGVQLHLRDMIVKSFENNIPCIDGMYWYQLGWGSGNPKLSENFSYKVSWKEGKLYVDCDEFHETARVALGIYTYPHKIIHNKRELRRYTGKRYFNLTEQDHKMLSEFWTKYPDGIMFWG